MSNPLAKRYSIISAVALMLLIASPTAALVAFGQPEQWIQVLGVLVVPLMLFLWIFSTLRGLHAMELQVWQIPSTYVSLGAQIVAVLMCVFQLFITLMAQGSQPDLANNKLLYIAALTVIGIATLWCLGYNIYKTRTVLLATSLTLLQLILTGSLVSFVFMFMTTRGDRDHVDAVTGELNTRERIG